MRRIIPLIAMLIAIVFCSTVYAHSGKTDGQGGHRDRDTGEYHYHHGYPAHDHYDMDGDGDTDCPYLFDGKTEHNGGSNGIVSGDKSGNGISGHWIFAILFCPLFWTVVVEYIFPFFKKFFDKNKK